MINEIPLPAPPRKRSEELLTAKHSKSRNGLLAPSANAETRDAFQPACALLLHSIRALTRRSLSPSREPLKVPYVVVALQIPNSTELWPLPLLTHSAQEK